MAAGNGHQGGRLLVGVDKISEYLGIGRPMFHEFRKTGMPVRYISGRWLASKDNLDEYFRRLTLVDSSQIEVPEAEE